MASWPDANGGAGYAAPTAADYSHIQALMSPAFTPEESVASDDSANVSRLYTLLLATVAGAGVALAVALLCCVLRTHMESRHRRHRDRPMLSGIQISQPRQLLGSRRNTARPTLSMTPVSSTQQSMPPLAIPLGHLTHAVAALEESQHLPAAPTDGAQAAPPSDAADDRGNRPFTPHCMSGDGEPVAGTSKGWAPDTHGAIPPPGVSADSKEGTTTGPDPDRGAALNSQLLKLLSHIGGEAILVSEMNAVPNLQLPQLGVSPSRTEQDGSMEEAVRQHRLQVTSVAACALRMAALMEVGKSPSLATLPPPWTPDFLELKLRLEDKMQLRQSSTGDVDNDGSSGSEPSDSEMEPEQAALEIVPAPKPHGELEYSRRPPSKAGSVLNSPSGEIHPYVDTEAPATQSDRPPSPSASWAEVEEDSSRGGCHGPPSRSQMEAVPPAELSTFSELGPSREASHLAADDPPPPAAPSGVLQGLSLSRTWQQLKSLGGKSSVLSLGSGHAPRHPRGRRSGQRLTLSPDDLDSTVLESRNLKLHGGTHIGIRHVHSLRGQKVEIYSFRVDIKRQMLRLCTLLESKPHPCIVGPLCASVSSKHGVLMPHSAGCDLEYALGGTEPEDSANPPQSRQCMLPWRARLAIAHDLIMAVHHLHSSWEQPLLHGSIHAATVNISNGFHGSLVNPGFLPASLTPLDRGIESATPDQLRGPHSLLPGLMPLVVDFAYLDPQYHKRGQFTPPADVYALGVVLLKLLTALPAKGIVTVAKEAYRQEMIEDVLDPAAGEWPPAVANTLMEFALSCCERRHTRRCKLSSDSLHRIQGLLLENFQACLSERGLLSAQPEATPSEADASAMAEPVDPVAAIHLALAP